jgi:hypothetical protein
VQCAEPFGDPLALYLRSLEMIAGIVPAAAVILPGHEEPFTGLTRRLEELRAYYERRCGLVEAACREGPKSARELVTHLFRRPPDSVWLGFVMQEAVTYANNLVCRGRLVCTIRDGIIRFHAIKALNRANFDFQSTAMADLEPGGGRREGAPQC